MKKLPTYEINVTLEGLADLMFDRFIDHSDEKRAPEEKLNKRDDGIIVMPSEYLWSFLFRQKAPVGCVKKFEKRKAADYLSYGEGMLRIDPREIPIIKNGKEMVFMGFNGDVYVHSSAPVTKASNGSTIKQEVVHRPVISLPWSISFKLTLVENEIFTLDKLRNYFDNGGLLVALGAYRPRHGRFYVKEWEVT